jgi:hypothetical protein
MAATVVLSESNGTTPTVTDSISRGDWLSADSVGTSDKRATYPITKPGSGYAYSYEKWHRLKVTAMGGSTQVDTIRHYISDSAPGGGWTLHTSASTGTPSNKTFDTVNGPEAPALTECPNAMPTSDPAAANISGTITEAGYSGYVVSQARVDDTATAGFSKTITWKYSEVA